MNIDFRQLAIRANNIEQERSKEEKRKAKSKAVYDETVELAKKYPMDGSITLNQFLTPYGLKQYDIKLKHCGLIIAFNPNLMFDDGTKYIGSHKKKKVTTLNTKYLLTRIYDQIFWGIQKSKKHVQIDGSKGFIYVRCENDTNILDNCKFRHTITWLAEEELYTWICEMNFEHFKYDLFVHYMIEKCPKGLVPFVYVSNGEQHPHIIVRGYTYINTPNIWIRDKINTQYESIYSGIRAQYKDAYDKATMEIYNKIAIYEYVFSNRIPIFNGEGDNKFVYD